MSGQTASSKSKRAVARKTTSVKTSSAKKNLSNKRIASSEQKKYASEQKKSTGKIVAFVFAVILVVGGIFIYNKVKTVNELNDNLKGVIETGKELEKSSSKSTSSPDTSSSSEAKMNVQTYREVLDEYMNFMESYVAFMKRYKNASQSEALSMMSEYTEILNKQMEWAKKIDDYDDELKGELSDEDYAEFIKAYTDVVNRATKLILEIQ